MEQSQLLVPTGVRRSLERSYPGNKILWDCTNALKLGLKACTPGHDGHARSQKKFASGSRKETARLRERSPTQRALAISSACGREPA